MEWYKISFSDEFINLDVNPNVKSFNVLIDWKSIIRVCFKTAGFLESDELYIFVEGRSQSYLIPMEGSGGLALFSEIIKRGLFDANVAIKLATMDNELHCFPID